MGRSYGAICNDCGTEFQVNDGPSMIAIPLRCEACGHEEWFMFGLDGPIPDEYPSDPCKKCGGAMSDEAPHRCPKCRSTDFRRDETAGEIMYD